MGRNKKMLPTSGCRRKKNGDDKLCASDHPSTENDHLNDVNGKAESDLESAENDLESAENDPESSEPESLPLSSNTSVNGNMNRLFDHIRYSADAIDVLPNRSWAIHYVEVPLRCIVVSQMTLYNLQGRGLEPFYFKQMIFDDKLNYELFLLNTKTVLKGKSASVRNMAEFESILDYVESLKLCDGGPEINQYHDANPECAYKDPFNKWRHNLCTLQVEDRDICESCTELEDLLKRRTQRVKCPAKARNFASKRKKL